MQWVIIILNWFSFLCLIKCWLTRKSCSIKECLPDCQLSGAVSFLDIRLCSFANFVGLRITLGSWSVSSGMKCAWFSQALSSSFGGPRFLRAPAYCAGLCVQQLQASIKMAEAAFDAVTLWLFSSLLSPCDPWDPCSSTQLASPEVELSSLHPHSCCWSSGTKWGC